MESFRGPGGTWAGGPSERKKHYASNLHERDALISSYEHLTGLPDPPEALMRLRKIASLVKPIMRKRGWHVNTFTEFLPEDPRLLGLNINHGHKICVRLRYSHHPATFLPIEQCVDTMLHELSHIVHGPHDAKFHALWDELRTEHETLLMRGFTGEGFLTPGHRLGGTMPPPDEMRRLARQNAEQSRQNDKARNSVGGFRLGGKRIPPGQDARRVIANAIDQRNTINRGCASGSAEAEALSRQAKRNTISVKSSEDDANDRAIAEALLELMEEEEYRKLERSDSIHKERGYSWNPEKGFYAPTSGGNLSSPALNMSEEEQIKWAIAESAKAYELQNRARSPPPHPKARLTDRADSAPLPDSKGSYTHSTKRTRDARSSERAGPSSNRRHATPNMDRELPPLPTSQKGSPEPADLAGAISAASAPPWEAGAFRLRRKPTDPPTVSSKSEDSRFRPSSPIHHVDLTGASDADPPGWACDICTCINPPAFLACDACGLERTPAPISATSLGTRPSSTRSTTSSLLRSRTAAANLERISRQAAVLRAPESMGWSCSRCATFMEHKYWTCSVCGLMKGDSRANEHVVS